MEKISVVIITKNEEKNIERCLKSVQWADEIVVVDSGSIDRTIEICLQYGCKIIDTEWMGFGRTKKLCVDSASYDWIFSIDADEEVTESLCGRIKEILSSQEKYKGYRIKRNSFYLGRMIKYCWGRDFPLRLFNRRYGNFNDKTIHESVRMKGPVNKIKEPMLHYAYPSIESHIKKMSLYSSLGAERLFGEGKRAFLLNAVSRGFFKFLKMYLLQMGFLDKKEGFVLSVMSAFGVSLKYFKFWEMRRQ